MIEINLGDLIQALENKSPEIKWFVDGQTGKLHLFSEDIDLGDDGAFADQLDIFPERYIEIERIPAKIEFRFMIDFVNEIKDNQARVDVAQTFSQKRPVQQFLKTVSRYPNVQKGWSRFKQTRQKAYALELLATRGIEATIKE